MELWFHFIVKTPAKFYWDDLKIDVELPDEVVAKQ